MVEKAKNFKNPTAYKKWLAYGHISKEFENTPGNTPVKVAGKKVKPVHAKKK